MCIQNLPLQEDYLTSKQPGKNYSGSRNVIYCKGLRNSIYKSPISGENTKLDKNVTRTIFISGIGIFGNVVERSYAKSSTHTSANSEKPLPCRKKGWNRPVISLKNLNKFISYEPFKMEGLHCLKFLLEHDDLLCKIDLKDTYFSVSNQQKLSKVFQISMIKQPIQISLPKFWTRTSSRNFYKIKSSNRSLETGQYSHYLDNILLMGNTLPEILMARDTLIFLLQHLPFVINFKKSVLHHRVSGLCNRYRENEFRSFSEKN